jgi:pimeloyl-ACP methyl ester carboxylesterase
MSCLPSACSTARPALGYVEAGAGETVLLLHGSAASGAMWRPMMAALRPLYRVVAPDLIGYGKSAPWSGRHEFSAADEAKALRALLPCCGEPYHLVGYSYGGLVALCLALSNPVRVRTLTLIEPVFFAALRHAGRHGAYRQVDDVGQQFRARMARQDRAAALRGFVEFWSGAGAWARLPEPARSAMLAMTGKIALDWQAAFGFDPDMNHLTLLAGRTALVRGDRSPEPMRHLVDGLHALLPGSTHTVVPGADHLLPLTHAGALTAHILAQLHHDAERRLR